MKDKLFDMSDADLNALQKAVNAEKIRRLSADAGRYRELLINTIREALSRELQISISNGEDEVWFDSGDPISIHVF